MAKDGLSVLKTRRGQTHLVYLGSSTEMDFKVRAICKSWLEMPFPEEILPADTPITCKRCKRVLEKEVDVNGTGHIVCREV